MKLIFTSLLFILTLCFCAQSSQFNNALKIRLAANEKNQINTVLVQTTNVAKLISMQNQYAFHVNYFSGNIVCVTCDISVLANLIETKLISYAEFIEARKEVLNDTMAYQNRLKAVKLWTAPLAKAYNGEGVLIGIIDTGIDVGHGDFKDSLGKSRIKFLWDQIPSAGSNKPVPFNYGIEWTDAQINANLCTHNDLPLYGHGTHVSGIAAGNGLANGKYEGVASKADIIAVGLDFNKQGPTIADAVQYIFGKATLLGKPCVINCSLGDYYGSHDATNLEAQLIENLVKNTPGKTMVAAAGNAGSIKYHVKTQSMSNDTSFTWLANATNSLEYWCYADTNQIYNCQLSVGANRSDFSNLGNIGFKNYAYALNNVQNDTLKYNGNQIGIVKSSASINPFGVYELYFQILADTSNLLWRVETKGNGLHHAWNFDFVSSGLPNAQQYPSISNYIMPDSLYSIVSSFQCSNEIITVANYVNRSTYLDVTNSLQNTGETAGSLAGSSSIGPTRDDRQKPDISATGASVISSMALGLSPNLIANAPQVVAQGSMHVIGGGTSAAAPVVAGLAALYLEKNPSATNQQVKNAIINCAYQDNYTGTNLPNYHWGYGKLDGKAAMSCGESIYNAINQSQQDPTFKAYPNPFTTSIELVFEKNTGGNLFVYDNEGKLLMQKFIQENNYTLMLENNFKNYHGLLYLRFQSDKETHCIKLIKEN